MTSMPHDSSFSVVVAGGGTAGHIEPALAVAEAVRAAYPNARITALGTERGLESSIVPARGFDLRMIPPVPVPRKPNKDLATLPLRLRAALKETRKILREVEADVVIGFGGYVSAPAYLAAKAQRLPFFVHEANARAGMANKLGVKLGGHGLAAVDGSGLPARVVGIPVKQSIVNLDRSAQRAEAREYFSLKQEGPVLLVTGGSQGAQSINKAIAEAAPDLHDAGIQVLHAYGKKNEFQQPDTGTYRAVPYIERMDLALAAADAIVCRSGAMTVAEVSAVGLPAVYVPLPHGNGEQELNALPIVEAGGGVIVKDADLSGRAIVEKVVPVLNDPDRLAAASAAARGSGHRNAAHTIAEALAVAVATSRAGRR
ncbi:undecaprenyldiphospho-muramoylpentapeptide beta-N-acetylglucosaminyltransferase [Corynebacterium sp. 320]|uniref:undecaprenyldiphospho-muramoylpentapeptide beta-N-acetylglucosaminyltransferase n=1 Tax=Corynebacterium TaxID=1716 RepID=UPI00125CB08C|nr:MULTISPECIES: undecaprenyldiphospho-muramoylpentapeptide beta-N-acetylglucosaminyltransferase [Corynebacterium]KAB1502502.1 undecaprenyldiphospho-muramoylpentapeptide beta-N-acetylglucosaminyltransferase [Corynebacterium sp. 320]KAB1551277.1 undecaprenyldiphospho-muramoylpentapeptide beta-N-acetylglucosaminyltransferase [Corynebacterium sp. 321]KAB1551895.1 undecaprenyldiphospho-muramoylpentapeptide beta-N-acetylglucosaminyltransferase [Corynebacterium sp. 319]KAB3526109.1 undecaprenyldiphos